MLEKMQYISSLHFIWFKSNSPVHLDQDGIEDRILALSDYGTDNSTLTEIIQSNNLQLKKELLAENRMRIEDRKRFIEVLDNVHMALKNFKTHPDVSPCQEFVELATKWFRREIYNENETNYDVLDQARTEDKDGRCFKMRGFDDILEYADNREDILKSSSSISREICETELKEINLEKLAAQVDYIIDAKLVSKMDEIKSDLGGLQLMVQNSQDRVTQERRIQQVAQAAWRARFDIQLRTIKRFEARYQKVCRCLMKFRRRVQKEQKPEKKMIKKNKKMLKDDLAINNDEEKCNTNLSGKQNQLNLKNIEGTAFLQGRLKAAGIVLAQNKTRIQELTNDREALQKEVKALEQELLRVSSKKVAMSFLNESQSKEDSCSSLNKNVRLSEDCELLTNEIMSLKDELELAQIQVNVLKDEKISLLEGQAAVEDELNKAVERLREMEEIFNHKLSIEKTKVHSYEQKFSEFYKQSGLHVQEARNRITAANKKLREFFKMIQIFLEKVEEQQFLKSAPLTEAYEVASSILNISSKDLQLLKRSDLDNYNKWTNHCRALAKSDNFAEEMAEFLFNLVSDKNCFISDAYSDDVEVGSVTI